MRSFRADRFCLGAPCPDDNAGLDRVKESPGSRRAGACEGARAEPAARSAQRLVSVQRERAQSRHLAARPDSPRCASMIRCAIGSDEAHPAAPAIERSLILRHAVTFMA